jgi:hypothetical protein
MISVNPLASCRAAKLLCGAFLLAMLAAPPAFAKSCLAWDAEVTLRGFEIAGVFPGPPEYESVGEGDAALSARLLYLDDPVCIAGETEFSDVDRLETELVQLACPALPERAGERVEITGTLFAAHTGYHVTPALLACGD